jgi:hypothetical protein
VVPGSGIRDGKNSGSGIRGLGNGINISDQSLVTIFRVKILKFFVNSVVWIWDLSWKNSDPLSGTGIEKSRSGMWGIREEKIQIGDLGCLSRIRCCLAYSDPCN